MYKYLMATVLFVVFALCLEPAQNLLSNFLHLEKPVIHEIDEGDWFSKIALRNYGDSSYGKELAVINRAPDRDLIFPGEKVIVPSFNAIQKIRNTKRLSVVNQLVREQQEALESEPIAANKPVSVSETSREPSDAGPNPSTAPSSEGDDFEVAVDDEEALAIDGLETEETSSASLVIFGIILGIIALAGGVFYFIRKRKEEDEEVNYYSSSDDEEKEHRTEHSIYFDQYENENDDSNGKGVNKTKRKKEEVEVA